MKFTNLQKYKHDTIGKFHTLKDLIELIDEENIKDDDMLEILSAADEVFVNMTQASKELLKNLNESRPEL